MGAVNLLIQMVGVGVGIYLMVTRSASSGIALIAVVAVGHFAFTQLSNFLMLIHQKRLSQGELQELQLRARFEGQSAAPAAWRHIANGCGLLYLCFAVAATWFFLQK